MELTDYKANRDMTKHWMLITLVFMLFLIKWKFFLTLNKI
jgi:hypothetical protein